MLTLLFDKRSCYDRLYCLVKLYITASILVVDVGAAFRVCLIITKSMNGADDTRSKQVHLPQCCFM